MAPKPLVSIVLPTFNRAHLVGQAIESVLAQSYPNWDLIIVDDNSTDNTAEVIAAYCQRDGRLRTVRNDTHSHCCAGARNRGVDEVRGEYVAFLDSDDSWPEYHLMELIDVLEQNLDVDWVFADLQRVDETGKIVSRSKLEDEWLGRRKFLEEVRGNLHVLKQENLLEAGLKHGIHAALQTSLIRAKLFSKVRIREVFGVEDHLFTLEAAAAGVTFAYVLKHHLRFLVHSGNVSGANQAPSFQQLYKIGKALEQLWTELVPLYIPLNRARARIVRQQLADLLVWQMANSTLRPAGQRAEALRYIMRGMQLVPWRWRYWKTFMGTLARK